MNDMSDLEFLYNLDYDYRKAGSTIAISKILAILSENDYEKTLTIYEELKRKMYKFVKEEKEKGHIIREPPPEIYLKSVKALIDFYFGKISRAEFKNIVDQSYKAYKSHLISNRV